jgi:eukaryotic-like serine/threonine-protein kinase
MSASDAPTLNLPGYVLQERIGAGGYGEVWSATAPGGLNKAVKFVFGRQDEKRAINEMRALDRVREVRHPFLLSLERIEILDGRLIVVTELADGSMRDRFAACRAAGLAGIPREELLSYLAEAADALDFLVERHEIAHLDVKPENLLMLAGHVKVADFGLAKSIGAQVEASLVGGMTPAYAAPEVFRGHPGPQSDQYSLAIVYQELLVGALPFAGQTAAELTLQHLNHEPQLGTLSEHDRFAISRALAKDPLHRFENCRAFVRALAAQGGFATESAPASQFIAPARPTVVRSSDFMSSTASVTQVFADGDDPFASAEPVRFELEAEQCSGERLVPPLADISIGGLLTPTLVIGLGGAAGRVMRELRRKVAENHLGGSAADCLPMLLMDTDPQTLAEACRGGETGAGLRNDETIGLLLRRPQDYRNKADRLLGWLGRRWLYNIPRSLRTEGIRPLGRLALVDHARQTFQRIRKAMSDTVSEPQRAAAATGLQQPLRPKALRVVLLSSISGGSGGGMLLDVVFAVRALAEKLSLEHFEVTAVLLQGAGREPHRGELARVNAFASLAELNHFLQPDTQYPGDAGCGLPSRPRGEAPFEATYVLPLGDQLDGPQYEQAIRAVADYLWLDCLTPAGQVLAAWREEEHGQQSRGRLRSFAVQRADSATPAVCRAIGITSAVRLLERWRLPGSCQLAGQSTTDHPTDSVVLGAAEFIDKLKLHAPRLTTTLEHVLEAGLGGDRRAALEGFAAASAANTRAGAQQIIDEAFALENDLQQRLAICHQQLQSAGRALQEKLLSEISRWLARFADHPGARLHHLQLAYNWIGDHLQAVSRELGTLAKRAESERIELGALWLAGGAWRNPTDQQLRKFQANYYSKRLQRLSAEQALRMVDSLRSELAVLLSAIQQADDNLAATIAQLTAQQAQETELDPPVLAAVLKLADTLDARLQAEMFTARGGLVAALLSPAGSSELADFLAHYAPQEAQALLQPNRTLDDAAATDAPSDPEFPAWRMPQLGVTSRRLRVQVEPTGGQATLSTVGLNTNLKLPGERSEQYCLTEFGDLSLRHLAAELIEHRTDYAQFAERTHARRDIAWRSLLTNIQTGPLPDSTPVENPPMADPTLNRATAVLN